MFCQSCGSEISVELKYCNRCGANLSTTPAVYAGPPSKPLGLALPTVILGLTLTIGMGIVLSSATELARNQVNWAAITWMVIFSMATLFGCIALLLRFWLKVISLNRESQQPQIQSRPQVQIPSPPRQQFQPQFESVPSVTEHTTRTFSHVYREDSDPAAR